MLVSPSLDDLHDLVITRIAECDPEVFWLISVTCCKWARRNILNPKLAHLRDRRKRDLLGFVLEHRCTDQFEDFTFVEFMSPISCWRPFSLVRMERVSHHHATLLFFCTDYDYETPLSHAYVRGCTLYVHARLENWARRFFREFGVVVLGCKVATTEEIYINRKMLKVPP